LKQIEEPQTKHKQTIKKNMYLIKKLFLNCNECLKDCKRLASIGKIKIKNIT
jgi:hypothetical protein